MEQSGPVIVGRSASLVIAIQQLLPVIWSIDVYCKALLFIVALCVLLEAIRI